MEPAKCPVCQGVKSSPTVDCTHWPSPGGCSTKGRVLSLSVYRSRSGSANGHTHEWAILCSMEGCCWLWSQESENLETSGSRVHFHVASGNQPAGPFFLSPTCRVSSSKWLHHKGPRPSSAISWLLTARAPLGRGEDPLPSPGGCSTSNRLGWQPWSWWSLDRDADQLSCTCF